MRLPRPPCPTAETLAALTLVLWTALPAGVTRAQEAPPADARPKVEAVSADSQNLSAVPKDLVGLLDLDRRIRAVVEKTLPATVGLLVGNAQGSGVLVSADGYVLTAAHVSGEPGQRVSVVMPDGTQYRAVSLGRNGGLDDGLVRIVDPAASNLPHVALGRSKELPLGTWTVALGHPGGYQQDRPPVVRVGRLLVNGDDLLLTDNTLVGGDSGGPLFDLDGRLIGIHSRIGDRIQANIHVPVDRFLDDWDTLVASKDEGSALPRWMRNSPQRATDGMRFDTTDLKTRGALVIDMAADGPADKAGMQINDRIVVMDGRPIQNGQDLVLQRLGLRAGEAVVYRVLRNGEEMEFRVIPTARRRRGDDEGDSSFFGREDADDDGNDGRLVGRDVDRQRMDYEGRGRRGDGMSGGMQRFYPQPDDDDNDDLVVGVVSDKYYERPGVLVTGVTAGGPADRAGIEDGDVVFAVDGRLVRDLTELRQAIKDRGVGAELEVRYRRGETPLRTVVVVARAADVYPNGRQ